MLFKNKASRNPAHISSSSRTSLLFWDFGTNPSFSLQPDPFSRRFRPALVTSYARNQGGLHVEIMQL